MKRNFAVQFDSTWSWGTKLDVMKTSTTDLALRSLHGAKFITFEGGEGAGKSTQIAHLAKRLEAVNVAVMMTREPGGSPFAEEARRLLLDPALAPKSALAQALLFYAARADHLEATIRPALDQARWVLCDRFSDSTRAYQGAAGGVDAASVEMLDRLVVGDRQPDLTVLMDIDPAAGLQRANARRLSASPGAFVVADTFESRTLDFHQRLRVGFLEIAKTNPQRVVVVDAFQNELAIGDQIWRVVSSRFNLAPGTKR
jgi:dTMP kinase